MVSHAFHADGYKPRHHRGWRRNRDRRRGIAGGSLEGMLAAIPSMPRPALARLVQQAIDRMDDLDGDPDLESNGDEQDNTGGEDDFHNPGWRPLPWGGPGCPVSDTDCCAAGEDDFMRPASNGQLGTRDDVEVGRG